MELLGRMRQFALHLPPQIKKGRTAISISPCFKWSGREDLNLRSHAPKEGYCFHLALMAREPMRMPPIRKLVKRSRDGIKNKPRDKGGWVTDSECSSNLNGSLLKVRI